ncbi:MAG: ribosomal-protein-alanine N-acetyltransferase [Chloroflexota bacterium]|nr:MAG: ribosomal-protein-alanine N-acetyltransferase [Chloroflexota bacterium]
MRFVVDWMRIADIPAVVEIERESFGDAWPPGSFERELVYNRLAHYLVVRAPQERPGPGKPAVEMFYAHSREEDYYAAPGEGTVVGHVGMWLMFDEAHITTIAIRPSHRGLGLGELLLIAAAEVAIAMESAVLTLEVRVSNVVAQRLYEKYSFVRAGLRRGYYAPDREDALIMTSEPVASAMFQSLLVRLKEANRERLSNYCTTNDP